MFNPEQERMGICVQASGKALHVLRNEIMPDFGLLSWAAKQGAHIKRVDYAIDLVNDDYITPIALFAAVETGEIGFKGKSYQWLEKSPKNAPSTRQGGSTLYLGSRSSDRFLRVYDKAAQKKLMGVSWTRLELELKDRRAQQYAESIAMGDWHKLGRGQIFDYLTLGNVAGNVANWLQQLMNSIPFALPRKLERLESKPDEFMQKIVLPFLRKRIPDISDKNLIALRTLANAEVFARDWYERQHDTE